jgi:hypothetical protein
MSCKPHEIPEHCLDSDLTAGIDDGRDDLNLNLKRRFFMRARRLAVLAVAGFVVGALTASTGHAEFTQEEAAEVLQARGATLSVSSGMEWVSNLMNTYTDTRTRPIFGAAMRQAAMASSDANAAIALLLNAIPLEPGTAAFNSFAALPRTERVARAWSRLDRAIASSLNARQTLNAAKGLRASDRQYQDWLKRAGDAFLTASQQFNGVNRRLAYANPNPETFPRVVGPHGDFARAEQMLWLSQSYAQNAMLELADAYVDTTLATGSGTVFRRLSDAADTVVNAMVLLGGVTWTPSQAQANPFFRTLEVLQALTDHARLPAIWRQAIFDLHVWKNSSALDVAVTQTDRITDAWMHSDGAAWRLMIFPDCSQLNNPQGCGGR